MPDEYQDRCLKNGVPSNPVIAVDYGNKTNYRTYEDVVISVFADGENEVEICRSDEVVEKNIISGKGNITRRFDRGYYTVKHKNSGASVEFCVTDPQILHTVENGRITVKADSCDPDSKILYMEFRERSKSELVKEPKKDAENNMVVFYDNRCASLCTVEELSDEEKTSGIIKRKIPEDAGNFKIYFENKYGIWTHTMIKI